MSCQTKSSLNSDFLKKKTHLPDAVNMPIARNGTTQTVRAPVGTERRAQGIRNQKQERYL